MPNVVGSKPLNMLRKETEDIQGELAAYCKDGELRPVEGARTERLHHYRRLIYNIIDDALENAYPIAKSKMQQEQWREMVDDFIAEHKCQHPQLFRMPGEFVDFVLDQGYAQSFGIPYLNDLLLFEWVEVEVHTMADQLIPEANLNGNFTHEPLVFLPYIKLVHLHYPIHHLNAVNILEHEGDYFLLVYRQENGTVQYVELNELTYTILDEMMNYSSPLFEALDPHLATANVKVKNSFFQNALLFIQRLHEMGVVLGTIK